MSGRGMGSECPASNPSLFYFLGRFLNPHRPIVCLTSSPLISSTVPAVLGFEDKTSRCQSIECGRGPIGDTGFS